MPVFEIDIGGKTFEVDAPDQATALSSLQGQQEQRGPMDKLLGTTGPRYQTWPEKAVRGILSSVGSAATLPGDVYSGGAKLPSSGEVPGSVPFGDPQSAGNRVADLAMVASPLSAAARAGEAAIPGMAKALVPQTPKVPTAQELKATGSGGYDAARNMGVEISPSAVQNLGQSIRAALEGKGIIDARAPDTFKILKTIENPPAEQSARTFSTIDNISALREWFGEVANNFTKDSADRLASRRAIEQLDEWLKTIGPPDVMAGNAATAAKTLEVSRGNYAAAMRSNDITGGLDRAVTGAGEKAELNAAVANSGRNVDNSIRQRFRGIITQPKEISGFNDAELAQMERIAEGGPGRNAARYIGNLLGGGGGIGQSGLSLGGAAAGGSIGGVEGAFAGAALPVVGSGAKGLANVLARREVKKLDEMIRKRSPLYESLLKNPEMVVPSDAKRSALIRALLMSQQQ